MVDLIYHKILTSFIPKYFSDVIIIQNLLQYHYRHRLQHSNYGHWYLAHSRRFPTTTKAVVTFEALRVSRRTTYSRSYLVSFADKEKLTNAITEKLANEEKKVLIISYRKKLAQQLCQKRTNEQKRSSHFYRLGLFL